MTESVSVITGLSTVSVGERRAENVEVDVIGILNSCTTIIKFIISYCDWMHSQKRRTKVLYRQMMWGNWQNYRSFKIVHDVITAHMTIKTNTKLCD